MTYAQAHPDAPPVMLRWLIEGDTVHPHTHQHNHNLLDDRATFRMVTPPSDLAFDPEQHTYHWRINTWQVHEMLDPIKKEMYKFVKIIHVHFMTDDEIERFKKLVDFDAAVKEAIEAREIRIAGYPKIGEGE